MNDDARLLSLTVYRQTWSSTAAAAAADDDDGEMRCRLIEGHNTAQ